MSYAEALEQQVRALRICSAPGFKEVWMQNWLESGPFSRMWEAMLWSLQRSESIYVAPPLCGALGAVARQPLPPWTLTEEGLLTSRGFCWFAADPGYRDPTGDPAELVALSWFPQWVSGVRREGREFSIFSPLDPEPDAFQVHRSLTLLPWYKGGFLVRREVMAPWGPLFLTFGSDATLNMNQTTLTGAPITDDAAFDGRFLSSLFATLMLFAQQRLVTAAHERAERHARKRVQAQGWTHEPLIRVVKLRTRETRAHTAGESDTATIDWSCRWVVRGHWRQQFFPSRNEHRPLWILPHLKGPEEKPLKPPRATVFAIVR